MERVRATKDERAQTSPALARARTADDEVQLEHEARDGVVRDLIALDLIGHAAQAEHVLDERRAV